MQRNKQIKSQRAANLFRNPLKFFKILTLPSRCQQQAFLTLKEYFSDIDGAGYNMGFFEI